MRRYIPFIFSAGLLVSCGLGGETPADEVQNAKVELADTNKSGVKLNGVNTARINAGWFENSTYGRHDRYAYIKAETSVVIFELDGDIIIISLETDELNSQLYATLVSRAGAQK